MAQISTLDFVRGYNAQLSEDSKRKFVQSHVVTDYVPMMRKIAIGENLVKSFYKDNPVTGKKEFHHSTVYYDILYTLNVINEYTDIQVDFLSAAKEYEYFDKYGLQDVIFDCLPKREESKFSKVCHNILDDAFDKEYRESSLASLFESKFDTIGLVVEHVLDALEQYVRDVSVNLDDAQTDK